MSLLDKFERVVVKAENRIAADDKAVCEAHQSAYEAALTSFQELIYIRQDMEATQKELMGERGTPYREDYLYTSNGPRFSVESIENHIGDLHEKLISAIVSYFNQVYHVSIDGSEVCRALLPEEPESGSLSYREAQKEYRQKMQDMVVHYEDVVDQIILRMDGRSFEQQAFFELCSRCHEGAWNRYDLVPEYERKKNVIQFGRFYCFFESWMSRPQWKLSDKMRSILMGAAHFETGSFGILPLGIGNLLNDRYTEVDSLSFDTCTKVKGLRMFKKGRVDLKFATEADAAEFITTYLGTEP